MQLQRAPAAAAQARPLTLRSRPSPPAALPPAQPLKGLLDPAAMARLSLGEALTNLVLAPATSLADVKASVNWMYAAKMKSEGAAMYEAACALR